MAMAVAPFSFNRSPALNNGSKVVISPQLAPLEEVFKLIFTKLYDETKSRDDKNFIDRTLKKELKFGNKNASVWN